MKKIFKMIFILLVLLIGLTYLIPSSSKDFFKLYNKEDLASRNLKLFQSRKTKTILVNHVKWNYYAGGKGKKTILFLHGMGGAYDLWWQQIMALENNYKVISYSLPEEINSLEQVKNGIEKILETEKVATFYGIGTSMGGYILQYLVQKMPKRIEKAVFGNTFPVNDLIVSKNRTKSKLIPLLPEILISKLANKQLKEKLLPAGKNSELLAAFLPSLPFSKKQFINRYGVVIDPFSMKESYAINKIPKLIIESDNDPLVEKELRDELKNIYSKAQVYTFHNEGHFPYINSAKKYNEVITSYFDAQNPFDAIEKTIHNYFLGRKSADIELLKSAFSNTANLYTLNNNKILKIPLQSYLNKVMEDGEQNATTSIIEGSIIKNIASFQTSFVYPKVSYTDYLTIMKVEGEWKIIAKTFTKN